ncbi:beta strand repeat-containing protein [Tundrisphaera lichenicola]|uniref:beta strand repeat-containing protein n=1 Tax=Tundrisphaera lichenicola TaxID=2029860 RepID=UPI003EBD8405
MRVPPRPRRSQTRPSRVGSRPTVEPCEPRLLLATFTVTSTGDGTEGLTLRSAIEQANADPDADLIQFAINGLGTQSITPQFALPTIINPVTIDGTSQPGYFGTPLIVLDGSNAGFFDDGLTVDSPGVVIQGLAVTNFGGSGINLSGGTGTVVRANYLGVDPRTDLAAPNFGDGVSISAQDATIGGTSTADANVIGGNRNGVSLQFSATGAVVIGNRIGAIDENTPVPNRDDGVIAVSASGNLVGQVGAPNLIVSNGGSGVHLIGSSGNTIQANSIGTTSSDSGIGLGPGNLGNASNGILLEFDSSGNTIGGSSAGQGNIIANNLAFGLSVFGSSGNLVQGNRIGTDSAGLQQQGNGTGGVFLGSSTDNTIGGAIPGSSNVISSNVGNGVLINGGPQGSNANNLIQGNFIGVGLDGVRSLGNTGNGIQLDGSAGNSILGNILSANNFAGIYVFATGSSGNTIRGNLIGLDGLGRARPNGTDGVFVFEAPGNTIGGTSAADRNVISGNGGNGVSFRGPNATGNLLQGNYIGTDPSGNVGSLVGNIIDGVFIRNAPGNTIGGTAQGAGNVISQNRVGVDIETYDSTQLSPGESALIGSSSDGNVVQGNRIGTDATGTQAVGNYGEGVLIVDGSNNIVGGTDPGAGNLLSANLVDGVSIISIDPALNLTSGNVVQGNIIGLTIDGTNGLGNGQAGVRVIGGLDTTIGGLDTTLGDPTTGAGNVISGNSIGVVVDGFAPGSSSGLLIQGNVVGLGSDGLRVDSSTAGYPSLRNTSDGIVIEKNASGVTVGGTVPGSGNLISGNSSSGIRFASGATGDLIQGNLIGVALDGLTLRPNNQSGIFIAEGSNRITVGGTAAGAGNVISGNSVGVTLSNEGSSQNLFQGNLVGLAADGSTYAGNIAYGFLILGGASGNTIGGSAPGARNVISGNGQGIQINGPTVEGTVIQGNYVGLDITGRLARGNQRNGIGLNNAARNRIGGTDPGAGNVVSANGGVGIILTGTGSTGNLIDGNLIGLNAAGTQLVDAVSNLLGNANYGIQVDNATANTIGGATPSSRNVISGNRLAGIEINGIGSYRTVVSGNLIGLDITGKVARGNRAEGILIDNAPGVVIGGATGHDGNIISGNSGNGISIVGAGSFYDVIAGNLIGVDASGLVPLGNALSGVFVSDAPGVTIGGTIATLRNVITGNAQHGVRISGLGSTGSKVLGNLIGVDASGRNAPGNDIDGVFLDSTTRVTVGGTVSGSGNTISGNGNAGVDFGGVATIANAVSGNLIGTDLSGRVALPNGLGVYINNAPFNVVGGTLPFSGNLISGNTGSGVQISGLGAKGNAVQGNRIGTDLLGMSALANVAGIFIDGAPSNLIGGLSLGAGNLISGNLNGGVILQGTNASGNLIQANLIGTDVTGNRAIAPVDGSIPLQQSGVLLTDAPGNVIGGSIAAAANVVSGNIAGVVIAGFNARGNLVVGNRLGTNASGKAAVANTTGVYINGSASNTIGGSTTGSMNLISGNTSTGINLFGPQTTGNLIAGNRIGTDRTGTAAIPNPTGIFIQNASSNTIGGTSSASGNLISGNSITGVYFFDQSANNLVQRNTIGFKAGGGALGNLEYGVLLYNASNNTVPRSGSDANKIGNSGIGNFREFTGPVPTSTTTTSSTSKNARKSATPKGPKSLARG